MVLLFFLVLRQKLWIKGFTKKQNFMKESFIS